MIVGRALRLPPAAPARAARSSSRALGLCVLVLVVAPQINGARRWLRLGPVDLPAVGAREARALHLGRRVPRAPPRAADARRAARSRSASLTAVVLRPADAAARPRHDDHALPDAARACSSSRARPAACSRRPARLALVARRARRSGSSRTGAPASSASSTRGRTPQGAGFQTVQAIIGIGSGGLTGEGLGQGVQKIFYLPEAHTDMIFAIIGEELGLRRLGVRDLRLRRLRVRGLPGRAPLPRPVRQAARGRDHGARLRPGGRQPRCRARPRAADRASRCPFVSYGGSSLVCLLAAVGILLNIAGNERVVTQRSSRA